MSATKEFTLAEVTAHNTKKDLYMVIHDKVYDCSSFVDEHPYVTTTLLAPQRILFPSREACDGLLLLSRVPAPIAKPNGQLGLIRPSTQSLATSDHKSDKRLTNFLQRW